MKKKLRIIILVSVLVLGAALLTAVMFAEKFCLDKGLITRLTYVYIFACIICSGYLASLRKK